MITINLGRRELGKTTLSFSMISKLRYQIILDPRHQFTGPVCKPIAGDIYDKLERGERVLIHPGKNLQDITNRLADIVRDWVEANPTAQVGVLLDECGLLDLSEWEYLFRCLPRHSVYFVLTTHRPVDIPTFLRGISDTFCLFRATQDIDLVWIEKHCGRGVSDQVRLLKSREFIVWDDALGTSRKVTNPSTWFVDFKQGSAADLGRVELIEVGTLEDSRPRDLLS